MANANNNSSNSSGSKSANGTPKRLILGIDLGTSSVKVSLLDADNGRVFKSASRETKSAMPSDLGATGNEQDPQKILTSLQFCVSGLGKELLMRVVSIGISGQMHGVVFWKRGDGWNQNQFGRFEVGSHVSQLYTWQDERCTPEFISTLPAPDSHLRLATGHGCLTTFWLQRNKDGYFQQKGFDCSGTIQDFVVSMLCGLTRPKMSTQLCASWGYFNTTKKQWNLEILKGAGFPCHLLPEVAEVDTFAGALTTSWYKIPEGTPVTVALGDLQCSILSSLNGSNEAVLNLSTSAQLAFPVQIDDRHDQLTSQRTCVEYFPYFDDKYIAVVASLTGGNVMDAFVNMLQQWTHEFGFGVPESMIWDRILVLGKECADTDLIIHPTIHGERHKPNEHACVTNITTTNLQLGSVYRALCRGIVENLHGMMPVDFLVEHNVTKIVGSGSGLLRNDIIKQEFERIYSLPISYRQGSDAAVGAAMAARAFWSTR